MESGQAVSRCRGAVALAVAVVLVVPASAFARAGDLDTGFGSAGVVLSQLGSPPGSYLTSLVSQPDGKVVAAGNVVRPPSRGSPHRVFGLMRVMRDGRPDPRFGSRGKVLTDLPGETEGVTGLVRLSSGKLVAAGRYTSHSHLAAYGSGLAVVRYLPDGRIDRSFGKGGRVLMPLRYEATVFALVRKHDNRLIVLYYQTKNNSSGNPVGIGYTLVGLRADGSLDRSFGRGGFVRARSYVGAMALQRDGKIVVAGIEVSRAGVGRAPTSRVVVTRYLHSGRLDTTFGAHGTARASFGLDDVGVNAVLAAPTGDVVLAGHGAKTGSATSGFLVAELTARGRPRTSFGNAGAVVTNLGSPRDGANAILRQPDGKLVAGGVYLPDVDPPAPGAGLSSFGLLRLLPSGRLDPSFGAGGRVVTPRVTSGSNYLFALTRRPDGGIVAGGGAGDNFGPGDTSHDTRFGLLCYRSS